MGGLAGDSRGQSSAAKKSSRRYGEAILMGYEFGPFRLDVDRLLLFHAGEPVAIGPKVVETLLALVERPNDVLSKSELVARIWSEGYVDEANLTQNVYVLRKLFRSHGCSGAIETFARRGYRFTMPVTRAESPVRPAPSPWRRRWPAAGACAALLALGAGAWAFGFSHEAPPPMPVEARLFTTASFFLNVRTRFAMTRSVVIFTRAIDERGGRPRDYAGRAAAYALMADYGYGTEPAGEYRARARRDALHALALSPHLGRAYAVLGLLALDGGRRGDATQQLASAVALAPNDADAREWYGLALLAGGDLDAASDQFEVAQRLNPLSIVATSWMASIAYLRHDYSDASAGARQGIAVAPSRDGLWLTLGLAQVAQGQNRAALESFEGYAKACRRCTAQAASLLSYTETLLGNTKAASADLAAAHLGRLRPEDFVLGIVVGGEHGPAVQRIPGAAGLARVAKEGATGAKGRAFPLVAPNRG